MAITYLFVSYDEKDIAKAAGAEWHKGLRQWIYTGDNLPDDLRRFVIMFKPGDHMCCRKCRQGGRYGEYPFSTIPDSGLCDDCGA